MPGSEKLLGPFIAVRSKIVRSLRGIVPPKDVEDIVQETYVRVCQAEAKETIRNPQSFMFRTARNLALDHVKRADFRLTEGVENIEEEAFSEKDMTYAQVASDEEFALFCKAVRGLPKQCRRAFVLKRVYGFSIKEIMAEMELSQSTVETHIVSGMKKCVRYLRDNGGNLPLKTGATSARNNVTELPQRMGGKT